MPRNFDDSFAGEVTVTGALRRSLNRPALRAAKRAGVHLVLEGASGIAAIAVAALRLARFNTQVSVQDKRYFQGLASPAAAGTLVTIVWFCADRGISGETVRWLMLLVTIGLGLLMFSRVRYFSFKTWPRGERIPIGFLFMLVLLIVALAIPLSMLEDAAPWLYENLEVTVLFHNGRPISIELPNFVELEITRSDPGIKGDTASNVTKPATLETGAVVQVPLFVKEGTTIRVDIRSGEYVERVG